MSLSSDVELMRFRSHPSLQFITQELTDAVSAKIGPGSFRTDKGSILYNLYRYERNIIAYCSYDVNHDPQSVVSNLLSYSNLL